ncbi:MAG: carboxypeptidase regulatory-like domain-containing protein [Gemmatimonadaceae bacterium]|nr:carboxypeptidase regulatory-like domain-containing protein [Gemmatimonadaceae bacterium]
MSAIRSCARAIRAATVCFSVASFVGATPLVAQATGAGSASDSVKVPFIPAPFRVPAMPSISRPTEALRLVERAAPDRTTTRAASASAPDALAVAPIPAPVVDLPATVAAPSTTATPSQTPTTTTAPARAAAGAGATNRIVGQVVDRETGRPLQGVQVSIPLLRIGGASDLDGRYEIARVPLGTHAVVARLLGYRPQRFDSVRVAAGAPVTLNIVLGNAPSVLQGVTVTAEAPTRSESDVGLLAMQRNAAAASDGISAAAMSRTPASNAADAITKVPGISVVGNKFVVVRGMADRYNGTTLNGAELPSPEPSRRVVPLDIFPSSLLESIITVKSATPDKPGDFSGGLVEVKTREFPEQFSAQVSVSQEANDLTTGVSGLFPALRGGDVLGFGERRRLLDAYPGQVEGVAFDRYLQRNYAREVVPEARRPLPNLGVNATAGGRVETLLGTLGIVGSLGYSNEARRTPNRDFVFRQGGSDLVTRSYVYNEWQAGVDLNGLLNVSLKPVSWTKLGWKSVYTRNAEDLHLQGIGFSEERDGQTLYQYQRRYIVRELLQTQLSGEHTISPLRDARFEWRATLAEARRTEPENNQARYVKAPDGRFQFDYASQPSFQDRRLFDGIGTVQADITLPFSIWYNDDASVKFGGLSRNKRRAFDAQLMYYFNNQVVFGEPTGTRFDERRLLTPNQLFVPENFGYNTSMLYVAPRPDLAVTYSAAEALSAGYAMVDIPVRQWLRFVGGARYETWALSLVYGRGTQFEDTLGTKGPDLLPSANLTVKFGKKVNLRMAYFEAISRPDAREISPDVYNPIAGDCNQRGSPNLRRTRTTNGDVRLEYFPDLGELMSVSAFVKTFRDPIVETIAFFSDACLISPINATSARNVGAEIELRRTIRQAFNVGVNLTFVRSVVDLDRPDQDAGQEYPLAGQSPVIANLSFGYERPAGRFSWAVAANYFDDRVYRYGGADNPRTGRFESGNVFEKGRTTLDLKMTRRIGKAAVSFSGRNLLNAQAIFDQEVPGRPDRPIAIRNPIGRSISMKVSYDL